MTIIFQNINLNKKLVFAVLVSTLLISGAIFYSVNKAQAQQVCSVSHDFGSAIPTSLSVSHDFGSAIPTSLSASDDFESGTLTNWQQVSCTWTTGSGFVEQTNNTQGAYESFLFLNQPTNLPSKYEMSVKMMPMSSSASWYQKAGIVFGYQNAQDYYVAGWHYFYQYGSYYGRFSLIKGNTNTELAAANINWTPGQTGDLKRVRDGSNVKVYLDGVLQINYDGATLNGGKIGLYTNDMTARFDNVAYSSNSSSVGSPDGLVFTAVSGIWQTIDGSFNTDGTINRAMEQANNTQGAYESFLFLNQPTNLPSKYEMSVKMMPMSSSASWYQKAGIVFGYQNAQDYYVAGWHYFYQYGSYYGRFSLRKGNTNTELAAANINWTPGQTGDLKLVRDGSNVKVYLDGVLQINYDGATLNGGKIGLYTNDMTARFDNVAYSSNSSSVGSPDGLVFTAVSGIWQTIDGSFNTDGTINRAMEQANNTQGAYESFLFLNQPTNLPSKYEMSVKMMPMSSSASWYQKAGIVFGYQNAQDYYVAGWHYFYQYGSYYGRFSLRKGNTNTELAAANINWTPGQTGDLKLVRDGSNVKVYLDGVLQINYDG